MPVSTLTPSGYMAKPDYEVVALPAGAYSVSELVALYGQGKGALPHYKDSVDKVHVYSHESSEKACGHSAIRGTDGDHNFAKVIYCGREWCEDNCGKDWSAVHQQRFARLLPKAQVLSSMGYFVLEFPVKSRANYRTKAALSEFGKRVKGAFIALGYDRGFRRWHYFSDKDKRRGGRRWFGDVDSLFNPHLNVIVEGRYIQPDELEGIKDYLRMVLDEPDLIVNYSYRQTVNEMVHCLKYVTRATFKVRDWDNEFADELYNFRNTTYWGKWPKDEPAIWSLDDIKRESEVEGMDLKAVESLHNHQCPVCGKPVSWSRPVNVKEKVYLNLLKRRKRLETGRHFSGNDLLKQCRDPGDPGADPDDLDDLDGELVELVGKRGKTEADIIPFELVEQTGIPLGAGYYRLPDTPKRADDT